MKWKFRDETKENTSNDSDSVSKMMAPNTQQQRKASAAAQRTVPQGNYGQRSQDDASTVVRSGSSSRRTLTKSASRKKKKKIADLPVEDQLKHAKEQVAQEKAGKRKLFHSLVKLANELRRTRDESVPLVEQRKYIDRNWSEGGIWRAPELLPGVTLRTFQSAQLRDGTSYSDIFFSLVIATAFTRIGDAIKQVGFVDLSRLLYFGVFWTVWGKEVCYSTRFDTTDVSAQVVTLITCFAVLFGSFSVHAPIDTEDGGRVMKMAAFVSGLHLLLHVRVVATAQDSQSPIAPQVIKYAVLNILLTFVEMLVWLVGVLMFDADWPYRWLVFVGGIVMALRVQNTFLPNDFHVAGSKRGLSVVLLLGLLLQSVVQVASEFFDFKSPEPLDYAFVGSACALLYGIKLLYVDDNGIMAEDHALSVNNTTAFFFTLGHFGLLLSTTVLGSGLNMLTHEYFVATEALQTSAKKMVCGGFASVLFWAFFAKSMHLKRLPDDGHGRCLFVTAFTVQSLVQLAVVVVAGIMAWGDLPVLQSYIVQNDVMLLASLAGATIVVVVVSWLDDAVELSLYETTEHSRNYRVSPFGFWWCLKRSENAFMVDNVPDERDSASTAGDARKQLAALAPLLGNAMEDYQSTVGDSISNFGDQSTSGEDV